VTTRVVAAIRFFFIVRRLRNVQDIVKPLVRKDLQKGTEREVFKKKELAQRHGQYNDIKGPRVFTALNRHVSGTGRCTENDIIRKRTFRSSRNQRSGHFIKVG